MSSILPKSKLGKAIRYAIKQWTNLEVYLSDGGVESKRSFFGH